MEKTIITVTQVNTYIKSYLESAPMLRGMAIKGEISNCKKYPSGHLYFTLKDDQSVLKAVMFKYDAERLNFDPENGQKVIASGKVGVYVRDGAYQLTVNEMEPDGAGSLFEALEKLKVKLHAEGLFDQKYKKELPKTPFSLGIVTASTGAAIRDMIHIARRRFPMCEIVLYPTLVQGKGAAEQIISGIEYFNRTRRTEVIIIGRGGGSIEDLWAFNEEKLARAVFASELPIISAVGHETDVLLTDFTADLRAPTPSAAVERALSDSSELKRRIGNVNKRNAMLLKQRLESERKVFELLKRNRILSDPLEIYAEKRQYITQLYSRICEKTFDLLQQKNFILKNNTQLLNSYNPLNVLQRGYSAAYSKDGRIIKAKADITEGEGFTLRLSDGNINAVRKEIENGK